MVFSKESAILTLVINMSSLKGISFRNLFTLFIISSSILFFDSEWETPEKKSKVLAFSYGVGQEENGYRSLPGANQEIKSISRKIGGKFSVNPTQRGQNGKDISR